MLLMMMLMIMIMIMVIILAGCEHERAMLQTCIGITGAKVYLLSQLCSFGNSNFTFRGAWV